MSNGSFKFEKKVYRGWCTWCCKQFKANTERSFCGKDCTWRWMEAKATRRSEQDELKTVVGVG